MTDGDPELPRRRAAVRSTPGTATTGDGDRSCVIRRYDSLESDRLIEERRLGTEPRRAVASMSSAMPRPSRYSDATKCPALNAWASGYRRRTPSGVAVSAIDFKGQLLPVRVERGDVQLVRPRGTRVVVGLDCRPPAQRDRVDGGLAGLGRNIW